MHVTRSDIGSSWIGHYSFLNHLCFPTEASERFVTDSSHDWYKMGRTPIPTLLFSLVSRQLNPLSFSAFPVLTSVYGRIRLI